MSGENFTRVFILVNFDGRRHFYPASIGNMWEVRERTYTDYTVCMNHSFHKCPVAQWYRASEQVISRKVIGSTPVLGGLGMLGNVPVLVPLTTKMHLWNSSNRENQALT